MTKKTGNVAVGIAKEKKSGELGGIVELSSGIRARLLPVSPSIISEAQSSVAVPEVPKWYNDDRGDYEDNPDHPDYLRAMKQYDADQNMAAIDAMVMFGLELVDGVPEDDAWLKKLKLRERMGFTKVKLADFDLEDEIDVEFLYKRYIAVGTSDLVMVMRSAGITEEDIASASESFQSNT